MKEEILAAVMFLVRFIEKSETFPRDQLENFKNNLTSLLTQRSDPFSVLDVDEYLQFVASKCVGNFHFAYCCETWDIHDDCCMSTNWVAKLREMGKRSGGFYFRNWV